MNKLRVPLVLQMENVECGAASLAMVLRYFGKKSISLEQLRTDCGVSRDGVTAKGIKKAAKKNGLVCRAFRANPENIKKVALPAVIHWNMGHFVVLCGYGKKYYYINDPALGKYRVSYEEFDRSFTGIVLTFEKSEEFIPERGRSGSGFTYGCIRPFIPRLVFVSFALMCVTVFGMILPFFNSAYIDNILLEKNAGGFTMLVLSMAVVMLLSFLASVLSEKLGYETQRGINISLSTGFMEKILKLPITFFSQRTPGELANRQLGSFESAELVTKHIAPLFFHAALILLYCIAAFAFNIYAAVIGIGAVILNAAAVILVSGHMSGFSALAKKNDGLFQASVASAVDMIETIKSCSCENAIFSRIAGTAASFIQSNQKTDKLNIYLSSVFYFINQAVSAAILSVGAYEILIGDLSVGGAIGAIGMLSAFLSPVGAFVNSASSVFMLKSIAERTDDTMKYKNEDIFLSEDEEQTAGMSGEIKAENVCFRYPGSADYALKNMSFTLKKGESLALAGESGSGKSTAAKLISGLYCETEGSIYYNGAKKKELKKEYFHSKVAVVGQSAKLYEGTVFDNITMWDGSITYDDVVAACRTACIHNDIADRKDAYYEKITEDGRNFSGGQKQRIEIARAIVRKPEVLILDEATSALDAKTEKSVMKNILSLGITLIIIAHRLSTIRDCDEILVFKDGEIAERGNHASLMQRGQIYYELVSDMGE